MVPGLVSILLTTYNRPTFLMDSVSSIFHQTYKNYELIILDDNSNSSFPATLTRLYDMYPNQMARTKIYKSNVTDEQRQGVPRYAIQINHGFTLMEGEFVGYLCDDDEWAENKLQVVVNYFNANPDAHVVCGYQNIEVNNQKHGIRTYEHPLNNAPYRVNHSSVVHRVSCLDKTGPWRATNVTAGDAEFWQQLHDAGYSFHVIPEVLDTFKSHGGSWYSGKP